jgi:hypothetical protein
MQLTSLVAFVFSMFALASLALSQNTADAPAVVTLYTSFLDPLPQQVRGFSVKHFKLRTMHALVDKGKSLQNAGLRFSHVEIPGHDDLIKR